MMRYTCIALLMTILLVTGGCKTSILAQRGPYLHAYHDGNLSGAEQKLDQLIYETSPSGSYSPESSWMLLDRATTRLAQGKAEAAIADYVQALEALDYYRQKLPAEHCAQVLLQDEISAYQASDFEQILSRVYFALALLHVNDESNAFAILRQAEEFQMERKQLYACLPFTKHFCLTDNGLSKYLLALLLERRSDYSNAALLYREASRVMPFSPAIPSLTPTSSKQATVLVICHNGNAPYRISTTCHGSVASTCALEMLLASKQIDPACSSLTGIPVPALRDWPDSYPMRVQAILDGQPQPLLPFYNVRQAAVQELDQNMPLIAARGAARLLARRAAVGYVNRQDPNIGIFADIMMLAINENTRADTRSWTTLPSLINVARFDVEPGQHQLTLQIGEGYYSDLQTCHLTLCPHDLCVIQIFNIHPRVKTLLIPSRYTMENNHVLNH